MRSVLRFDVFELDPRTLELRRQGASIPLRPQPCRLLGALVNHPGTVVTREELRHQLWPAGLFVKFDQGVNSCMRQVRAALGDDHGRPRFIETLPRRGYRFLLPVTQTPVAPTLRRQRLAVLPFSSIQQQGECPPLLLEGFSEELISCLACLRPNRIGVLHADEESATAGVDYVVKGSIRQARGRMRITAHLIDARDNTHVWGSSFEREADELFRWQDEAAVAIAKEILGTLER
jgi:TolB-like protein